MQATDPRHVAALTALAEAGIPVDVQELLVQTGALAKALDAKSDPALIGIAEEMKESGGHWMPCTGCYDTEDGYPTQKYAYSPALRTDIGCGCHECGGLGAVWWHMTDEELAQFEKDLAGIDATETSGIGSDDA